MALVKAENVSNQFSGLGGLPVLRQLGLMIGLAASVAIGVALVMWSQTPSYRLLYSNLNDQDVSQVVTSLEQAGIDYKHEDANGTVWVDGSMVHDARMRLASQGLPQGTGTGYEIMDGQDGFGTSQFIESVRYQRALEGELARTISTMNTVQAARVHLAVPKQSVFVRDRKKPSASVVLTMFPGRKLESGQIQAIVNLVGASVPDLEMSMITVVDQRGELLTDNDDSGMAFSAKQLDYKHQLEKNYVKRIEDILTPIVGSGKVKAQVNTEIDFTVTEKTQELFNPDQGAVRSEQTVEESTQGNKATNGVPGALTNQPPADAQLATTNEENGTQENSGSETESATMNSRRRSVRNFELDKTISHTRLATGTVHRLSVAVLVDDKVTDEGTAHYTDEELARLTSLVRDAVGFNPQRGDSVNVVNASFTVEPEPEPLPEEPFWKQAWVWNIAKQVVAGLAVIFLIFGVLKPEMRELASKGVEFKKFRTEADKEEEDQVALGGQEVANQLTAPVYESHVQTASGMVDQDPKTVAQVLKNWVATDGG